MKKKNKNQTDKQYLQYNFAVSLLIVRNRNFIIMILNLLIKENVSYFSFKLIKRKWDIFLNFGKLFQFLDCAGVDV